jgi:general stress protein 26
MGHQYVAYDKDYKVLSGEEGLKKISESMRGIRVAMVATVAKDGTISARPMVVQNNTFDGRVWFLTRSSSEKLDEILEGQHVTLTFADPTESMYLTLKGRASISRDRKKIGELWSSMYNAWFPLGQDDPEIAVVRVEVTEADCWEASSSRLVRSARYVAEVASG